MHLDGLCERGKSNLGFSNLDLSKVKYHVVVSHEGPPRSSEARNNKLFCASVEIDCENDWRGSEGDATEPGLALDVGQWIGRGCALEILTLTIYEETRVD
jgi:hypothetical protein